jgi:hypothetical protein
MRNLKSLVVLLICGSFCAIGQNTVCFEFSAPPSGPGLNVFTKYIEVFGCGIYAETSVPDEKVLHAAAIFAELLDNDEDGVVDDPALLTELQDKQALMPIFASDGSLGMNTFFNNYDGEGVGAVLWQQEIDPAQPGYWGADASVEEIMHTINSVGHVNIYPQAFSLEPNSSLLSAAMDAARGGQFMSVPNNYPEEAWYHYDDFTCDYQCMAIEYLYWMQVSNMDILNDVQTCNGIANEWEPCSQALLQSMDVLGYALITDPQYKLPQNAPDGNYCPNGSSIQELDKGAIDLKLAPNPSIEKSVQLFGSEHENISVELFSVEGRKAYSGIHSLKEDIDLSTLDSGTYTYAIIYQDQLGMGKLILP